MAHGGVLTEGLESPAPPGAPPDNHVPPGGTDGQVLTKASDTDLDYDWETPAAGGGEASGPAGGVLAGTYPDPSFANDMATQAELNAHITDPDPHTVYATDADLAFHAAAPDPHPTYSTDADLTAHVVAADPHSGYATDGDLTTHAGLPDVHHARQHSATSAPDHTFPGGTTNFLRADGTFAAPPGGGGLTSGAPALTLGTTNAAGVAATGVATDATIAAFDATNPTSSAVGDTPAPGSAGVTARRDHRHGRELFAVNALVLGATASAGAASTPMRSNDTIAAFDLTNPTNSALGDSPATGSVAKAARRDHVHGREAAAIGSSGHTMATARLLGRSTAATGAIEEIVLGTNLSFTGTTLNAAGGGGGAVGTDTIWDAKGDLAAGTGADTASKLTVGADDTVLMADSAAGTGLKWVASATPATIGTANAAGTSDDFARGSHVHQLLAEHVPAFSRQGVLTTAVGALRWYNDTGRTLTIVAIRASVGTAPTGAAIICDINKNGTTVYTTQGNRPTIAISGNTIKSTNPDVTTYADGDYVTVDIDQIGSTVAGSDLTVTVLLRG